MLETKTLLIVDDCDIDREVVREYLSEDSQANYEILEASEASEGLAICREIQCDLILLDFRLPDMTGLEFLEQRQQQTGIPPSIIMMTGQGCETVAVQALKSGATNYLSKEGLEAERLIQAVQNAIRQRRLQAPQETVLPEAMAAAVLRFRRSLELLPLLEAAVHEIRYLTQCDRVSIVQTNTPPKSPPLAQSQSPQLSQLLRHFTTAQQRRRRGRPPKYRPSPIELTPIRWPLQFPGEEAEWGWLLLEYLPDTELMNLSEETAFEAFTEQLAIAISHAVQYKQACGQTQQLQSLQSQKDAGTENLLIQARKTLSTVLTASNTLVQHRKRLTTEQQNKLVLTLEEHSREFLQLLEKIAKD